MLCLLKGAESAYLPENQAEAKLIANSANYYLKALQSELKTAIGRLDSYIAKRAKGQ